MFPWERSGFRYHEALAIHELLPDTLFFSLWELTDPFPVPVHPLADFPAIAAREGVTDAYAVFQLFLEGLCGMRGGEDREPDAFAGLDISAVLAHERIRLHGSIYPGGGFVASPEGLARTRALAARLDTTLSYVPEVLAEVPGAVVVSQAFTATAFYEETTARWSAPCPLVCLFAADAPPRKGLDVALAAFRELDPADFHLHVVGPHLHRRGELPERLATFHGWLSPRELRELHRSVHVFVSPVSAEAPGPPGSHRGVVDGFPTQAAADAMSSGCLLVSANPAADHRVLTPGEHYRDCPPDPSSLRAELRAIADDVAAARRTAALGSAQVRARMDVRSGTAEKLAHMGFAVRRSAA
jgi:glycosyltransferase involved in cell wall biosynthesis